MADIKKLLGSLPAGLRTPLVNEYKKLTQNYMEHRWETAELSAGKICEIVYCIIKGHIDGNYPVSPSKPQNMVVACRQLEQQSSLPRSFQILIPRMLPALYEIRNNRGVGHVGSEVNANNVDATLMFTMVNWIMAELVRTFHTGGIEEAQIAIDALGERITPLVWDSKGFKKVLSPSMTLKDKIIVLIASTEKEVTVKDLMQWTESTNKTYYKSILKEMHKAQLLHFDDTNQRITLLPDGSFRAAALVEQHVKVS